MKKRAGEKMQRLEKGEKKSKKNAQWKKSWDADFSNELDAEKEEEW